MPLSTWEPYFKSEVRSAGNVFLKKDKVRLSQSSDTQIHAYVQASNSLKVTLTSDSIESNTIFATCNCPKSSKDQLCKHIWAVLQTVVMQELDFLESKTEIECKSTATKDKPTFKTVVSTSQEAYKQKQADYRKAQYQKQKERAKIFKDAKKKALEVDSSYHPVYILSALEYFEKNGFPLKNSLTKDAVSTAKKKLAGIFHPDKDGSHDEILELNQFAEVLLKYARK
jgi:hypothetical protein